MATKHAGTGLKKHSPADPPAFDLYRIISDLRTEKRRIESAITFLEYKSRSLNLASKYRGRILDNPAEVLLLRSS
jgi:hypothetical protein